MGMPKAAVDHDRHLARRKCDVRPTGHSAELHAEPVSQAMQHASKLALRLGVGPFDPRHVGAALRCSAVSRSAIGPSCEGPYYRRGRERSLSSSVAAAAEWRASATLARDPTISPAAITVALFASLFSPATFSKASAC